MNGALTKRCVNLKFFEVFYFYKNCLVAYFEQPKLDPNQKLDLRFYTLLSIAVFNLNSNLEKLSKANTHSDINAILVKSQNLLK